MRFLLGMLAAAGALVTAWWSQAVPALGLWAVAAGLWFWAAYRARPGRHRKTRPGPGRHGGSLPAESPGEVAS